MFNVEIEEKRLVFAGTDTASISFSFTNVPFVTATSQAHNVNVWVESVTTSGCTVRTSAAINGVVHVHLIGRK